MAVFTPQVAQRAPFSTAGPIPVHVAPAGTFVPGTKVQVGNHRVVIERYLSEGGFAHVYVVRLPKPIDGVELAVLKRVAVPDKEHLANMRTEVETMKKLKGHKYIVKYIDSHASQLRGGGYEVFLLMEYCAGGGLIDFMNTRLQNRLTEPEILKIFSDVAEGVACMHYLKPPLLHRDLKVENVLISSSGSSRTYKLCDFGSAAPPRPAATSAAEGRLIEDDVQRHTTLQYRSPEMIDVYRKQPIDEKSDIWALGVLLYKLCYYTTPFEEVGQMATLNASFKYPAYPAFSDQLKLLIATMLKELPTKRPNIYQVLRQACQMQGKDVPIRDIYTGRSRSEDRQQTQPPAPVAASSRTGAPLAPPAHETQAAIPDIAPMRRGRPTKPVSHHGSAKPSPSPLRMISQSDPFASLDAGKTTAGDEISARFPTLDQFSLLAENGRTFEFGTLENKGSADDTDLSTRVTHALADDAFAKAPTPDKPKGLKPALPSDVNIRAPPDQKNVVGGKKEFSRSQPVISSPIPEKPTMVSTGTMTSPPSPPQSFSKSLSSRTIHRFAPADLAPRPSSQPRETEQTRPISSTGSYGSRLANLLNQDASRSQTIIEPEPKSPASSRPSLEGSRPPALAVESGLSRSRSVNFRSRRISSNLAPEPEYIGERLAKSTSFDSSAAQDEDMAMQTAVESDTNITSDVDFLRAKEEEEKSWRSHKRHSSGSKYGKRKSLTSISLTGTKTLLAGRFGDAFRKFEGNSNGSGNRSSSPSPSREGVSLLTPITGSVATDLSDDRQGMDDAEEGSPETRREIERRRLSAEEKRVAMAAAEYRKRVTEKGGDLGRHNTTRATSIQNKVHSLLKENDKPASKSAAGYGRFTDLNAAPQVKQFEEHVPFRVPALQHTASEPVNLGSSPSDPAASSISSTNVASGVTPPRTLPRPTAPPKPRVLRTGAVQSTQQHVGAGATHGGASLEPNEDWETNFSKRYPSLSGLEMVETEIETRSSMPLRTKEV